MPVGNEFPTDTAGAEVPGVVPMWMRSDGIASAVKPNTYRVQAFDGQAIPSGASVYCMVEWTED
jgi:hypothetical protein